MLSLNEKELLMEDFKTFCQEQGDSDEFEETNFYDLSVGWFLAKGADIETAFDLAIDARYKHQYWS